MTLSRSQIERLGIRLVGPAQPAASDLTALHELLLVYGDALEEAVATVLAGLDVTPTSRIKNTGTILEKLERYGGSWLKSIQDIAGMRIVGGFNRAGQDAMVAQLVELFDRPDRRPRVVDRREHPSHGYTAVHVIAVVRSVPVEIQVRTQLQHEWADLFEKLADKVGRDVRYGEPPNHWMTRAERDRLPPRARMRYDLEYELRGLAVELALIVAEMIDLYEGAEQRYPDVPELPEYRSGADAALADLREKLGRL